MDDICIDTHFKLDYNVTDIPEDEESDLLNMCSGVPLWEFKNNNATWVIDEISQSETVQRNVQNSETVNIDTTSTDAQNCQKKNAPNFFPIKDGKNTFIDEMKNINTARKTKSVMNTFDSFVYKTLKYRISTNRET